MDWGNSGGISFRNVHKIPGSMILTLKYRDVFGEEVFAINVNTLFASLRWDLVGDTK